MRFKARAVLLLQPAPSSAASSSGNIQQIASAVDEKSPLYHMQKLGFKTNTVCKEKGSKAAKVSEGTKLFLLTGITADGALLAPTGVDEDGNVKRLSLAELKDKWVTTTSKSQTSIDYMPWTPDCSAQWAVDAVKARVVVALADLSAKVCAESAGEKLTLYVNPMAVKAKCGFAQNKLALAPCTRTVKDRPSTEPCPEKHIDLGVMIDIECGFGVSFSLAPHVIHSKASGNFTPPFWFVQAAPEDNGGNMKMVTETIDLSVLVDSKLHSHAKMFIPILRNKTAIKAGDVLTIASDAISSFSPKKQKLR